MHGEIHAAGYSSSAIDVVEAGADIVSVNIIKRNQVVFLVCGRHIVRKLWWIRFAHRAVCVAFSRCRFGNRTFFLLGIVCHSATSF